MKGRMASATGFWTAWRVTRPFRFGLALGGGAARGLAHIGVLKALTRAGLRPDLVVGTSAGALVGGAYACFQDMEVVEGRFVEFASGDRFRKSSYGMFRKDQAGRRKTFFQKLSRLVKQGVILGVTATKPSFITAADFEEDLKELLLERNIEDLSLPFAAVATDIVRGREVVLRSGPIHLAVAASCALPGVLPPVAIDGSTLIDGGAVSKVPVGIARKLGADFVLGVDIHADLEDDPSTSRGIDIVSRSHTITSDALRRLMLKEADLVIRPEVGHIHWADFGRYAELIRLGEETAAASVPQVKRALRWAQWRSRLAPWTRPRLRAPEPPDPTTGPPEASSHLSEAPIAGRMVRGATKPSNAEV